MASNKELKAFGFERFSLAFAKHLLGRHPEWLPFASAEEELQDGLLVRNLRLSFPSQNPGVAEPLVVACCSSKIVEARWFPRSTSGWWSVDWVFDGRDDERFFAVVADWLDDFMGEKIAAICRDDGPGKGGSYGDISAAGVREGSFREGKRRTVVRSWRGSLDLDIGG